MTGASRGIGRATAELFAREGAAVAVNYRASRREAESLVAAIEASGGRALPVAADVSKREEVDAMVGAISAAWGGVDVLVCNAGILHVGTALDSSEDDLDAMIAVNLKGILHCVRAAAPGMIARRYGKIVNVSSLAALGTSAAGTTPYAATKAAVLSLTKRLALELGPRGINVNAICPGFIRTDMLSTAGLDADARIASLAAKSMLGRVGEPEDVALAALFLASDEASFISAQVLTVDGGRTDFLTHSA